MENKGLGEKFSQAKYQSVALKEFKFVSCVREDAEEVFKSFSACKVRDAKTLEDLVSRLLRSLQRLQNVPFFSQLMIQCEPFSKEQGLPEGEEVLDSGEISPVIVTVTMQANPDPKNAGKATLRLEGVCGLSSTYRVQGAASAAAQKSQPPSRPVSSTISRRSSTESDNVASDLKAKLEKARSRADSKQGSIDLSPKSGFKSESNEASELQKKLAESRKRSTTPPTPSSERSEQSNEASELQKKFAEARKRSTTPPTPPNERSGQLNEAAELQKKLAESRKRSTTPPTPPNGRSDVGLMRPPPARTSEEASELQQKLQQAKQKSVTSSPVTVPNSKAGTPMLSSPLKMPAQGDDGSELQKRLSRARTRTESVEPIPAANQVQLSPGSQWKQDSELEKRLKAAKARAEDETAGVKLPDGSNGCETAAPESELQKRLKSARSRTESIQILLPTSSVESLGSLGRTPTEVSDEEVEEVPECSLPSPVLPVGDWEIVEDDNFPTDELSAKLAASRTRADNTSGPTLNLEKSGGYSVDDKIYLKEDPAAAAKAGLRRQEYIPSAIKKEAESAGTLQKTVTQVVRTEKNEAEVKQASSHLESVWRVPDHKFSEIENALRKARVRAYNGREGVDASLGQIAGTSIGAVEATQASKPLEQVNIKDKQPLEVDVQKADTEALETTPRSKEPTTDFSMTPGTSTGTGDLTTNAAMLSPISEPNASMNSITPKGIEMAPADLTETFNSEGKGKKNKSPGKSKKEKCIVA